jgi:hypothetical protein
MLSPDMQREAASMDTKPQSLPDGFEPLLPYVSEWSGLDETGVVKKRLSSSIEDLRAFYEAGQPLFPKILGYMKERPIGSLTPSENALFKLALALIEISYTFEIYFGAIPSHLYDARKISREVRLEVAV